MKLSNTRLGVLAAVVALATAGTALVVGGVAATAAACTSPVRYAKTSNTIYLLGKRSFTLSDIKKACPSAPLSQVDRKARIWQLNADLVVRNGGTLKLRGGKIGGDVDTLRLRSRASGTPQEVSQLMANHGVIEIDSIRVTSWDDRANRPDTDPRVPASAGTDGRGRAFIRAISRLAVDGAPLHSAMRIRNSDIGYLGYYAPESYGITYKARGCDRSHLKVCNKVRVFGSQHNNRFHHNYMGTYAWGAKGIKFLNNRYDHNISYGLDPHDVSTDLTIDRNTFAHNGNHGVICSQLCDRLTITNNTSRHNGLTPWQGSSEDEPSQVHGIMLHSGVTRTVVSGNVVQGNRSGVGIAIFDSVGNTIRNNTITDNLVGVRLSVGAARNVIQQNRIRGSKQFAILLFKGNDKAPYSTRSGRPTGNMFISNVIEGAKSNTVKMTDADGTVFRYTTFSGAGGPIVFNRTVGTVIDRVRMARGQQISVTGAAGQRSSLLISKPPGCGRVRLDSQSTCKLLTRPRAG